MRSIGKRVRGKRKMSLKLEGKFILLIGASRGLGRALALDFAREGARGIALVARNQAALEETSKLAKRINPSSEILLIQGDIQKPEEIERVVAVTFEKFDAQLDVLVNNASTIGPTPMPLLIDYPLEQFRRVLEVNLISPFLLIQKTLPALIKTKGSIINVTSDAGKNGYAGWGAYGISKFGVEGMSKTWAEELKKTGVRVNLVDPGDMNTEMHRSAEPGEDPTQWANPEDVTRVFVYLASDESRKVTGRRFLAQSARWLRHYKVAANLPQIKAIGQAR
jgi:NAD(P)-dependent dehydrogenase (short-subunit alcohol dehydrogenase family)